MNVQTHLFYQSPAEPLEIKAQNAENHETFQAQFLTSHQHQLIWRYLLNGYYH